MNPQPHKHSTAELERIAWHFNQANPVGVMVKYFPIAGRHEFSVRRTRSEASVLSGHTAVVFLEGLAGCVALDHCEVVA